MGAYSRSFTSSAILTLVLYIVLWIPGLIANVIFLNEAKKVEQLTGRPPEGKGCLTALLVFWIATALLGCAFWFLVIAGGFGAANSSGS